MNWTKPSKANPWIEQNNREVYENPWIKLTEHDVKNPGGGDSIYGKVHFKKYALGIVALDDHLNTWLVGQWRFPLNEYSWEIPMGGGELEVDKVMSAQRELKEETGITAEHWQEVIKIHLSNCVSDEVGYGYVARQLTYGETEFDETEDLEVRKLPFEEAVDMVLEGKRTDSLSVATILKVDKMLNR